MFEGEELLALAGLDVADDVDGGEGRADKVSVHDEGRDGVRKVAGPLHLELVLSDADHAHLLLLGHADLEDENEILGVTGFPI